ncbi:MAG TPA: hypothetical protein ENO00_05080 [Deltaproteobacteria bacterium]|nr:hypothetical protein [Deltaproteobacteria bacterium]
MEKINISSFIISSPFGRNTQAFLSDNASGSTSQPAILSNFSKSVHL